MTTRKNVKIFLSVMVILTFILVGIYSFTRVIEDKENKKIENEQETQDDLAEIEDVTSTPIDTVQSESNFNFSTLKIEDLNFSIDYPNTWTNDYTKASKRLNIKSKFESPEDEVLENFQITFSDNINNIDLQTAYSEKLTELTASQFFAETAEEKEMQIAGTTAKSIEYKFNVATEAVDPVIYYLRIQHIIYIKDGQIVNITFSSDNANFDSYKETIANVLNSIK
jgi:hypothetical protein